MKSISTHIHTPHGERNIIRSNHITTANIAVTRRTIVHHRETTRRETREKNGNSTTIDSDIGEKKPKQ